MVNIIFFIIMILLKFLCLFQLISFVYFSTRWLALRCLDNFWTVDVAELQWIADNQFNTESMPSSALGSSSFASRENQRGREESKRAPKRKGGAFPILVFRSGFRDPSASMAVSPFSGFCPLWRHLGFVFFTNFLGNDKFSISGSLIVDFFVPLRVASSVSQSIGVYGC